LSNIHLFKSPADKSGLLSGKCFNSDFRASLTPARSEFSPLCSHCNWNEIGGGQESGSDLSYPSKNCQVINSNTDINIASDDWKREVGYVFM